jgi:hypothetical protein
MSKRGSRKTLSEHTPSISPTVEGLNRRLQYSERTLTQMNSQTLRMHLIQKSSNALQQLRMHPHYYSMRFNNPDHAQNAQNARVVSAHSNLSEHTRTTSECTLHSEHSERTRFTSEHSESLLKCMRTTSEHIPAHQKKNLERTHSTVVTTKPPEPRHKEREREHRYVRTTTDDDKGEYARALLQAAGRHAGQLKARDDAVAHLTRVIQLLHEHRVLTHARHPKRGVVSTTRDHEAVIGKLELFLVQFADTLDHCAAKRTRRAGASMRAIYEHARSAKVRRREGSAVLAHTHIHTYTHTHTHTHQHQHPISRAVSPIRPHTFLVGVHSRGFGLVVAQWLGCRADGFDDASKGQRTHSSGAQ